MSGTHDTPAHRAIALAGWIFVVIGLVGLLVVTRLYVVWVAMIFFGVAALPRARTAWLRDGRNRTLRKPIRRSRAAEPRLRPR
jgi:hypothetical protein